MRPVAAPDALLQAEALLDMRMLGPALKVFDRAEALGKDPDRCAAGRWMAYMLAGNFTSAWNESDAIRRRGRPDPHRFWHGEDLTNKRVIVRCLHGLGDAVQFMRYAPLLGRIASSVVWEVPPTLLELAPCFRGLHELTTWGLNSFRDWDVQVEVMELPYISRTNLADLPLATHYIRLPQTTINSMVLQPANVPRIGIVWSSGEWNPSRSISLDLLRPLFARTDAEFWNLQGGSVRRAWRDLDYPGLRDSRACSDGVLSLARVISCLDLVITVDTLAAHLAGALGVPAWVMLQYAADWRWMVDRIDSPWYPSLRLFRQPSPGDWEPVIASIHDALSSWLAYAQERRIA